MSSGAGVRSGSRNPNHELVGLEKLLDWGFFEREWNGFFPSTTRRPATAPCLVADLLYLQHLHGLKDEGVLNRWLESPYYQHFCGMTFFDFRLPIDPSSLVRWRKRIGEEGIESTEVYISGQKRGVTWSIK